MDLRYTIGLFAEMEMDIKHNENYNNKKINDYNLSLVLLSITSNPKNYELYVVTKVIIISLSILKLKKL